MVQVGDRVVELVEDGDRVPRWVGDGVRQQVEEPRNVRLQSRHGPAEWWPQIGSISEVAHFEQGVDGFDEDLVVSVAVLGQHLDGADEQSVRGVYIAVTVEQVIGARQRPGQRSGVIWIHVPNLVEQARCVAEVAQHGSRRCRQPGPTGDLDPRPPD